MYPYCAALKCFNYFPCERHDPWGNPTSGPLASAQDSWLEVGNGKQTVLLAMLAAAHWVFDKAKIPYWITGGTLMGTIRHGGFIPHDDDVDLECFEDDFPVLKQTLNDFFPFIALVKGGIWCEFQVYQLKFWDNADLGVDIFPRPRSLPKEKSFPSMDEVFPLKLYQFHDLRVYGPSNPDPYLARCYDPLWARVVKVWTHDFNWFGSMLHDPDRVLIPIEEYNKLIQQAGYACPRLPLVPTSMDELQQLLSILRQSGGVIDQLLELFDKIRLPKLIQRNRVEAEAQLKRREEREAALALESDPSGA